MKTSATAEKLFVIRSDEGYWSMGESELDAADNYPATLSGKWVTILECPADGVESLDVDELGRVVVYGPNQDEAANMIKEVYTGLWNQRERRVRG